MCGYGSALLRVMLLHSDASSLTDCMRVTDDGVETLLASACVSLCGLELAHNVLLAEWSLFAMSHCKRPATSCASR